MDPGQKKALLEAFDAERFRREAHAVVDQLADYLTSALERREPAVLPWRDPDAQVADTPSFDEEPSGTLQDLVGEHLARALHQHDPRCLGHQDAVPLPGAALATLVSTLLNNDPSTYEIAPRAVAMEQRLIEWALREVGFGPDAGGVLTSGGSLGNLTALLAARQAKAGFDLWTQGGAAGEPLCVLAADEIHYCVTRAVQIMGWGHEGCVTVPVDDHFRMRVDALPAALEEARRRGRRPIAVTASAGTTATGAFDDLHAIADFCEAHDLWLHVDGAHGGSAILSPRYREYVAGIERADSVVWDAHKLMMMPALLSAVLFREGRRSYETFRQDATYLFEGRPDEEWYNAGNRTLECTRHAMSTRLYTALRVHGVGLFRDYCTHVFDMARRFAEIVEAAADFELGVAPQANIVVFRYRPADAPAPGPALDDLQRRAKRRVVESGRYFLVDAEIRGGLWLRGCVQHPLTSEDDLRGLLEALRGA